MTDKDDTVERIKATIAAYDGDCMAACELLEEAAAEIVRLRAEKMRETEMHQQLINALRVLRGP